MKRQKAPLHIGDVVEYTEQTGTLKHGERYTVSAIRLSSDNDAPMGVYLNGQDTGSWWYFHRFKLLRRNGACKTCLQPLPLPSIVLGENIVLFNKGEIVVGCTTVSNAQVRAIAERLED